MSGDANWNYSGDPSEADRDVVRFLIGDVCSDDQQVGDKVIAWAIADQPSLELAAAKILRGMAAEWSRVASTKVGDVAVTNAAAIAKGLAKRADELDPLGLTKGTGALVLPSFGGLSISEKESLSEDTDAVQPSFSKGMNDIPGGPSDAVTSTDEDDPRIRR